MRQAKEIVKELVLGEGSVALSLLLGVIALWLFPIPIVIYVFYLLLLGYTEVQAHRWLRRLLTAWSRLVVCGVIALGLIAGALQLTPPDPDLFAAELHPFTFSFYTLILVGIGLFWLCIDAAKELRRSQIR